MSKRPLLGIYPRLCRTSLLQPRRLGHRRTTVMHKTPSRSGRCVAARRSSRLEPAQLFAGRANAMVLSPHRPGGRQLSSIHSNAHATCEPKRYQRFGRIYLMIMDRLSQSPRTNCPGQFWENRSQGCSRAHRRSANLCSFSPGNKVRAGRRDFALAQCSGATFAGNQLALRSDLHHRAIGFPCSCDFANDLRDEQPDDRRHP